MLPVVLTLMTLLGSQEPDRPLPDLKSFTRDVPSVISFMITAAEMLDDKSIRFDAATLRHFRYTEKETRVTLDSKGATRKTETDLYEVIRGPEEWQLYRRQISRNGVPLTERELEQQDREQKKREAKQRAEIEKATRQSKPKPQDQEAREKEQDRVYGLIADIYGIQVSGRDTIDDRSTIVLTFQPKPGVKPKDDILNLLHHLSLRAWLTENDHQLMKVECTLLEPVSFGVVLAKIQTGSTLTVRRQNIKEGVWAPSSIEANVRGRLLFVKSLNEKQVVEYSDFREYTVETILTVGDAVSTQSVQE